MGNIKLVNFCKLGHLRKININGRIRCRECEKLQRSSYRKNNLLEAREKRKHNYQKYKDKEKAQNKKYSKLNREKINERRRQRNRDHRHPLYITWLGLNTRCHNVKSPYYPRWGGRGVSVYEPWRRIPGSFATVGEENKIRFNCFVEYVEKHMGPKTNPSLSIDRHPNRAGNYEPGNIKWSNPKEQSNNTRSKLDYRLSVPENSPIYYPERNLITLKEFSKITNLPLIVVKYRYCKNWDAQFILNENIEKRNYPYKGKTYCMEELYLISGKVKYSTLRARIQDYNWSVERAMET